MIVNKATPKRRVVGHFRLWPNRNLPAQKAGGRYKGKPYTKNVAL